MENNLLRFVKSCLCLVAMAILAGCVVQSLNKFYTSESRTPLPAICGEKFVRINPEKLAKMVENKECELKSVEQEGEKDLPLYVSGPAEWMKFLEKFGADKELFKSDGALVFKKLK